jgi:hypothetical protein
VFLEPLAGDRDGHQTEIADRPPELADHRFRIVDNILKRQQTDRFQARIGLTDIGDKIIIGTAIGYRVVAFACLAHAKARRGKEHRYADPLGVHVANACRQIIVLQPAQTAAHQAVLSVRRQKRAAPFAVRLRQVGSHVGFFFDDVTVGINDIHSLSPFSNDGFSPEIARSLRQKSNSF